jgi:ATP-binding protein involved in chromosome partitioning
LTGTAAVAEDRALSLEASTTMPTTESDVLAALSTVQDPELHRDLVSAGMVKNLRVADGRVALTIELTTPACPLKGQIEADVNRALERLPGSPPFEVSWGAQVRRAGPANQPAQDLLPQVKNVVLVGAGKGGVGKSTVALNVAVSLARCGATVGLLDADFYGPSIPIMTGLNERPRSKDGKSLETLEAFGIKVMSIGFLVDPDQALVWRGPMLHGALIQLLRDVNWGDLDYLVLDLPPGTGDIPLTLAQQVRAAGVVLVSTPQDVALSDVLKAKIMFDKVHIPVLGLVENMAGFVCPHCHTETAIFDMGGGEKAAERMGIPFLGRVPLDLAVRQGGDAGRPIAASAPESPQAKAFEDVARRVAGQISVRSATTKLPIFKTGS